mgnify:CR=1 FL=1
MAADPSVVAEAIPLNILNIEDEAPEKPLPPYLREQPPVSTLLTVDDRLQLQPFIKLIGEHGYVVVGARDGRLVITQRPGDYAP